jgi:hypothetical protein
MRTLSLTTACFLLGFSVMTTGCSDPGGSAACIPVSLTVTYKGAPVEGAQVTFHSAGEGARTCQGRTDASGRAAIGTFSIDDGALAGAYKVSVAKAVEQNVSKGYNDPSLVSGGTGNAAGGGGLQAQDPVAGYLKQMSGKDGQALETPNSLPAKYASHETSGIAFTVQGPDANDFKVELTD